MTTPVDLITLALKQAGVLGVGQSASAEDVNDSFALMNMMLNQWSTLRYLVYHEVDYSIPCTGQVSYTVGLGGDFNVVRPDKIASSFVRMTVQAAPNQSDYMLRVIRAREDYNRISQKQQGAMPRVIFYDSGFPLGTLYPWSIPNNQFELHISVAEHLQQFNTIADTINLPPQYMRTIMYNLAGELRPLYQLPPDQTITAMARATLNALGVANTQVPTMTLDPTISGRSSYNPYSDIYS